jgi:cell division protein FtsB
MARFRFLTAFFAGVLMFVLLSVFFGPEGLWAMEQLDKQRYTLYENMQNLQRLNDDLSIRLTALTVDSDVIASYARDLGYVNDGEYLVKLTGLENVSVYTLETGDPIKAASLISLPDWFCKLAGVIFGFAVFLILSLLVKPGKKAVHKEVRVKDLYAPFNG